MQGVREGRGLSRKNIVTEKNIKDILQKYKSNELNETEAAAMIKNFSFEDLGFASVDHSREERQGFPEVIYAAGKTKEQTRAIMETLLQKSEKSVMATRAAREQYDFVRETIPEAKYNEAARIIYVERETKKIDETKRIVILTAGTSDIPVAEEARLTAKLFGCAVDVCHDCGVAGIHRLFAHAETIRRAAVVIVIAGMEGALASVTGGLTAAPVIAVPTSVGYGASFGGLSALLAMLAGCAAGVTVVNIDNGFGAAVAACKILRINERTVTNESDLS